MTALDAMRQGVIDELMSLAKSGPVEQIGRQKGAERTYLMALRLIEVRGDGKIHVTGEGRDVVDQVEDAARRTHSLYTDADPDKPKSILDRNDEVVLGMCKVCGRAEADLVEPCTAKEGAQR